MSASHQEIKNILGAIQGGEVGAEGMALATVVDVEGSSYRRTGARMLIRHDGQWVGTISGGCLEGNALRRAREVMRTGVAQMVVYDTRSDEGAKAIGASLGCNGVIVVWIEPLSVKAVAGLERLRGAFLEREVGWYARILEGGNLDGWGAEGEVVKMEEGGYNELLLRWEEGIQVVNVGGKLYRISVECVVPTLRLLVFGAGDDARPLVQLGAQMGWRVTVVDECGAKVLPVRFPEAERVLQVGRSGVAELVEPDAYTAAVLISHNYGYDLEVIKGLLPYPMPYIGMLGPRKRFERMDEELGGRLSAAGVVYGPVGLDIGAQTPFEIAVAIVAEVQAVWAGRVGGPLRERVGHIHGRKAVEA